MKKKLPGAHLTVPNGTPQQNKDYCGATGAHAGKPGWEELLLEVGTLPRAGERTDIENVREELKEGANMRQIVDTATSYQSIKIAEVWLKYNEKEREFKPEVRWYHGSTGKTSAVVRIWDTAHGIHTQHMVYGGLPPIWGPAGEQRGALPCQWRVRTGSAQSGTTAGPRQWAPPCKSSRHVSTVP
jgi:hypothetical protein